MNDQPTAWDRFQDKLESHGGKRTHRPPEAVTLATYQEQAAAVARRRDISRALAVLRETARREGADATPEEKAASVEAVVTLIGDMR